MILLQSGQNPIDEEIPFVNSNCPSFNVCIFNVIVSSNTIVKVILKTLFSVPVQFATTWPNAEKNTRPQISLYANKKPSPL